MPELFGEDVAMLVGHINEVREDLKGDIADVRRDVRGLDESIRGDGKGKVGLDGRLATVETRMAAVRWFGREWVKVAITLVAGAGAALLGGMLMRGY